MPIPKNITKEHIRQAARYIDDNGVHPKRRSRSYAVIIDKTSYPPKYIISVANIFANHKVLPANEFITDNALEYLKKLNMR